MSNKVQYRGRWFPVISETETQVVIESYGIPRTVLKDEVVYEEPVIHKDIVEEPVVKETEILIPKEDELKAEAGESKDLIVKDQEPKVESTNAAQVAQVPVGIDVSTETQPERQEHNQEVVQTSLSSLEETLNKNVDLFKEKMRKMFN